MTRGIKKKERKKSPSADDPIRRAARGGIKGSGATNSTKEGRKFDEAEKEIFYIDAGVWQAALRFEAPFAAETSDDSSVDRSVENQSQVGIGEGHFFLSSCAVAALNRESENRGRSGRNVSGRTGRVTAVTQQRKS